MWAVSQRCYSENESLISIGVQKALNKGDKHLASELHIEELKRAILFVVHGGGLVRSSLSIVRFLQR